ncbi:hypothetical protein QN277_009040 [Acacia crassicarpa]|uniref:ATPase family AAA domain-containing protein n=1 Tax=Acacia crassicarpa TaxID=499986 RepID=A0AAE1M7A5_9FABA|nr:hypothetical protein QN277_009040 [Acacia crassicarpa]
MVEAEGRARETKLAEEVNRQMLFDRANAERKKWVAAINTTSEHIGVISTRCTVCITEVIKSFGLALGPSLSINIDIYGLLTLCFLL